MISFFIGMVCGLWLMYLLQMDKINGLKNRINKAKQYAHERLAFLENCFVLLGFDYFDNKAMPLYLYYSW